MPEDESVKSEGIGQFGSKGIVRSHSIAAFLPESGMERAGYIWMKQKSLK